jgi:cytidylate kinase
MMCGQMEGDSAMQHRSVAIDGPSGAGKSTIARHAAGELGFVYLDTGAIYRAVGLAVSRAGLDPRDEAGVSALLPGLAIGIEHRGGAQYMYLNGEDVTEAIRAHEISSFASTASALPCVRAALLERQRDFARHHDTVMDGRDIGTVVLPGATVKIFLTATAEDRAMRRYLELTERGQSADYGTVLRDIQTRDHNDSTRSAAPLRPAEDAVTVDTTGNTLERSLGLLTGLIREKLGM